MYLFNREPGVFTARLDSIESYENLNCEGSVSKTEVWARFTFEDGRKVHELIRKDKYNFDVNDIGAIFKLTYVVCNSEDASFVYCDTIEKSPTQEFKIVRSKIKEIEKKIKEPESEGIVALAVIELIKEQKFTKFCELVDFACEQCAYGLADWLTLNGNFVERYLSSKIRTTL